MKPEELLEQFSTHLKHVIAEAMSLATSLEHNSVRPIHLLAAIANESGAIGATLLKKLNIDKDYLMEMVNTLQRQRPNSEVTSHVNMIPVLNKEAKRSLEKAMLLAYQQENTYVGTEHLLHGIVHVKDSYIEHALKKYKITIENIDELIDSVLQSTNKFPEMNDVAEIMDKMEDAMDNNHQSMNNMNQPYSSKSEKTKGKHRKKGSASALEVFTVNLTSKSVQDHIDPVIGRSKEIDRLIHILCRRNKNNPVLVGEPGVGKTAIVEGLAKRILAGDIPDALKKNKILSLDLTLLIAGTIYRGEFEARLKQIIDEITIRDDTFLFIDEIHNIIGAGSNQGTMDAANILKPALARGQLRCIGATTIDEYKKHITNDPALERRFQQIAIEEPVRDDAIKILAGVKIYYEAFHHVAITKDALEVAVDLSTKYVHDNFLPDKAIDLIDEASAAVRVSKNIKTKETTLDKLEQKLDKVQQAKEQSVLDEQFTAALKFKKEIEKIESNIAKEKKKTSKTTTKNNGRVTRKDIVAVLARKLQIDPKLLSKTEWEQLETLGVKLNERIIGQEMVVKKIIASLKQSYLGLSKKKKPHTSFLFIGPSGVGKTEMAKTLAENLFHDKKALIKLDMTEFAEAHGVSKLLGSPAGYVGYKERNHFLDEIRKRPYAVVLFDEIDKAHPDVIRLLLQILDEGQLTDSSGKKIYFNHAIIILTSNIGAELYQSTGIGFGEATTTLDVNQNKKVENCIQLKLKEEFGSALLGRLQTTCIFSPLSNDVLKKIVSKYISELLDTLNTKQHMTIKVDSSAIDALVADSSDQQLGARNIERVVENIVHDLIGNIMQKKNRKKSYIITKEKTAYVLR